MKAPVRARTVRGLTSDELLALPVVVDLDTANRALMIGRSRGYGLAKQGGYPVKVLRLGNAYRVVTSELLKLLGLERERPGDGQPGSGPGEHHSLCA
ncbi:hypothetical protein OTB20_12195 [Streptomyces sp. H27-H1]|uniref:hypothetical protein n=1 Tax=unclassified Streptomyces TaxID=2593676 RepID=UPI00227130AE|nr:MULTISPECIES: hypothetical protein [unclassified Streptomyces]MCY0926949.1 hypothetical protein [Streptomyces sp. H27-H1]MCY0933213.1 hypothetical protein [Streptomyces sp. H34-S4]